MINIIIYNNNNQLHMSDEGNKTFTTNIKH